jgi:hypothetical protein
MGRSTSEECFRQVQRRGTRTASQLHQGHAQYWSIPWMGRSTSEECFRQAQRRGARTASQLHQSHWKNIQVPRDAASVLAALSMATPWSVIKVDYQHAKDMATFRGERKRRVIEPGTWNIEFPVRIEAVLGTQSFVLSHSLVSVDFSPHKFHTVFLRPDDSCQTVKTNKR